MEFSKKVVAIRNGMEFSHGIRRALILALALVYFIQLGFNVVWITTLFAVSSVVSMFLEFPTGAVADYDSRKKSLMISFFLFSVSFFGIYFSNNFWVIAVFWFLSDVAWTFSTGAGSAWAIDALGIGKKKSAIVRLISRGNVFEKGGHILGGLFGFVIISISFRLIWLVSGLMSLIMFFVVWKYMEERNFKPMAVPHNYLKKSWIKAVESYNFIFHKKSGALRVLMLTDVLANIGFGIFYLVVPLFFVETIGLEPEFYSGFLGVVSALILFGPLVAEKISGEGGFRSSLFCTSVAIGILAIALAFSSKLIIVFLLFVLLKICETILDVVYESAYHHEFDSKIRASLGSIGSINWNLANSIGIVLAGVGIGLFGVVDTLIASGVVIFLTAFIYLKLRKGK